jgi:hypothetical protein
MRGDSIRDLYAKTLALLGLGVLAGTGALVDYWPSGVRLPVVESGFTQPEFSLALAVPDQPFEPETRVTSAQPRLNRRPMTLPVVDLATLIPGATELVFPAALTGDVIQTVALSRPAVLVPVAFAQEESSGPIGEEVSLSEPTAPWTESVLAMTSAPVALSEADDHGLLAGVVKATKSSLVLTGRKTGASIMGAFRVVSGAVRKALPN